MKPILRSSVPAVLLVLMVSQASVHGDLTAPNTKPLPPDPVTKIPPLPSAPAPGQPAAAAATQPGVPVVPPEFELPGPFSAREILQMAYVSSPNHTVRDEVTTRAGVNHYVIDSPFGTFIADGNQMLVDRIQELAALAQLKTMSQSQEFVDALRRAAATPIKAAEKLIDDPESTLASVPKGIGKFFRRVGASIEGAAEGREPGDFEDSGIEQALGLSATKRALCRELGVNPYSSNAVLQHELDQMAWAMFGGKFVVTAATAPIGGAVGAAFTGAKLIEAGTNSVYDRTPAELRRRNEDKLDDEMEIDDDVVEKFLRNPHLSPWHQTHIVAAMESLSGVRGRGVFLRDAAERCGNETDATFYEQTARLIAHVHANGPAIKRILIVNNLPVCLTADGQILLALEWDYAAWTPMAGQMTSRLQGMSLDGQPPTGYVLAITGAVSPRLRQELEARQIHVNEKLLKGPLN